MSADRNDAALLRWLRHAVTSGDGMPGVKTIAHRFACSYRAAEGMLGRLEATGAIARRPPCGRRPTIVVAKAPNA